MGARGKKEVFGFAWQIINANLRRAFKLETATNPNPPAVDDHDISTLYST
jgi:hypothetical protein